MEMADEHAAAIEQERQRISRELHDSVVQQIAFALYKLEFIQRLIEQQQFQAISQDIQQVATILEQSLQELRASINALRPPQIEQSSIQAAIASQLSQYSADHTGLVIHQHLPAIERIPEHLQAPIFRLLQEALSNIHQHAQASEIWITIDIQNHVLLTTIRDNGIGFLMPEQETGGQGPEAHSQRHLGLHTMRERVQEVGGSWQLHSQPGSGTIITASFPLPDGDTTA
ncbi:sensor histidine kinase [Dictyobacter aurantiacus]|uniref:Histidine kinase/HSP90-like ATPase domain-containing protein n=1 Tax=Dictyobacter aurantiacus TaxID=1936993 RepID=A0A401ZDM4_9CHLR|nr:sensor histidine kinase [Dictyobacter aurantiacus]GCE04952.1 hypothetical protein KDAU_22810 [Dictyobacter aurantiacus]